MNWHTRSNDDIFNTIYFVYWSHMETPPWAITWKCIFLALVMQVRKEHNAYLVTFLRKKHFHFCSLKLCSLGNSHKNRNFRMSLVLHKYLPLTSRFSPKLASEQPFSLVTLDKTSSAAASNYQLGVGQRGTTQDKSGQVGHNQPSHQYQCQVSAPMDVSLAHT